MTDAEREAHRQIVRAVFRQLLEQVQADQAAARARASPIDYGWFDEWLQEERNNT